MSSTAAYCIENGLDPFIMPDGTEWPTGLNPMYELSKQVQSMPVNQSVAISPKVTLTEQHHLISRGGNIYFSTFAQAKVLAKQNPGSILTREGNRFVVRLKERY